MTTSAPLLLDIHRNEAWLDVSDIARRRLHNRSTDQCHLERCASTSSKRNGRKL